MVSRIQQRGEENKDKTLENFAVRNLKATMMGNYV